MHFGYAGDYGEALKIGISSSNVVNTFGSLAKQSHRQQHRHESATILCLDAARSNDGHIGITHPRQTNLCKRYRVQGHNREMGVSNVIERKLIMETLFDATSVIHAICNYLETAFQHKWSGLFKNEDNTEDWQRRVSPCARPMKSRGFPVCVPSVVGTVRGEMRLNSTAFPRWSPTKNRPDPNTKGCHREH